MTFLRKNNKLIISLILIVFFIIEMVLILNNGDQLYLGDFNLMNNDDVKYIRSAWTLLDEHKFTYHDVNTPTVFIMPGYTIIIAFFMSIFGKIHGILALRIFQSILQIISLYLTYSIAKKVFNDKVAFISIILSVLYIPELVTPGLILTETVFKFLLVSLIYVSLIGLKSKKFYLYFLGGFIWALAMFIRPTIGLYPIVIFLMMIIYKYSFKDIITRSLLVLGIFIIMFSPWWARNYVTFNRFIPLTLSSGNPFLQGTYIHYDESKDYMGYKSSNDAIERNYIEMDVGIKRLKQYFPENKLCYLYWYTIGKSIYYWAVPFYYPNLISYPRIIAVIYHLILLALALSHIFITKYNSKFKNYTRKDFMLILSIIVYFNLVYLPYYTFSRYAYPTMAFVIIVAANSIYLLHSKSKHKS